LKNGPDSLPVVAMTRGDGGPHVRECLPSSAGLALLFRCLESDLTWIGSGGGLVSPHDGTIAPKRCSRRPDVLLLAVMLATASAHGDLGIRLREGAGLGRADERRVQARRSHSAAASVADAGRRSVKGLAEGGHLQRGMGPAAEWPEDKGTARPLRMAWGFLQCQHAGCKSRARYRGANGTTPVHCAKHSNSSEVLATGPRCTNERCRKFPIFARPGEKTPSRCFAHKEQGDVDVFNKKCRYGGCMKTPTFAEEGHKTPLFCSVHKLPGHVSLRKKYHKLCSHPEGCEKHPVFGSRAAGRALFCKAHKHTSHVDVLSNRCRSRKPPCLKFAAFGFPRKKAVFCMAHKGPGMCHVKSKQQELPWYSRRGRGRLPASAKEFARIESEGVMMHGVARAPIPSSDPQDRELRELAWKKARHIHVP